MLFTNKVVLVTGASLGIGFATARAFAQAGAKIAMLSTDESRGTEAANNLRQDGHTAEFYRADVSREQEVEETVRAITGTWGRVDVLVNNAGIYRQGDLTRTTLESWEEILSINLTGAFLCSKHVVPAMPRPEGGVIINVSSEAGLVGIKGQVAYNVSKAGMIALSRSCAVDLAQHGIRVNCVCPGTTHTPLVQNAIAQADDPEAARRQLETARPLNRLGTADEIASAILYLASDGAAYATGAVLSIDGGYTAQ